MIDLAILGQQRRVHEAAIRDLDEKALAKIKRNMKAGASLREVGGAYGISYGTIKRWLDDGLPAPRKSPSQE